MKDVQTYLEWFILAMKLGVIGLFEYTIIRFVLFKELSIGLFKIMTNKFKFNM